MIRIEDRSQKTEETLINLIKETKDDLFSKIDSFVGKVKTLGNENVVGANQIKELRERTDDHEERITQLESAQAA